MDSERRGDAKSYAERPQLPRIGYPVDLVRMRRVHQYHAGNFIWIRARVKLHDQAAERVPD